MILIYFITPQFSLAVTDGKAKMRLSSGTQCLNKFHQMKEARDLELSNENKAQDPLGSSTRSGKRKNQGEMEKTKSR